MSGVSPVDPGTDWWVAGPAMAAAAAALAALFVSLVTQRHEGAYRRAEQARHVNLIVTNWKFGGTRGAPPAVQACEYEVSNSSVLPVYSLDAAIMPWRWNRRSTPLGTHHYSVLRPQSTSKPGDFTNAAEFPTDFGPTSLRPPMRLSLTDASGTRWRREPDGSLRRLRTRRWFTPWRFS